MAETITIAGLILRDEQQRYLLIQKRLRRAYGSWNFPAGWADESEAPASAAVRETHQATGYAAEVVDDEPIYHELSDVKNRDYCAFLGRVVGGELVTQTDETMDARWFTYPQVQDLFKAGQIRDLWIMAAINRAEAYHENHRH